MPKLLPNHKIRKAANTVEKDIIISLKSLLGHLLDTLEKTGKLPEGFYGNNVIEFYKLIAEFDGVEKVKMKKNAANEEVTSALERWLAGQAIIEDEPRKNAE